MKFSADYHVHSRYSDGHATLKQNVEAAIDRGFSAVALTDHGPNHMHAGLRMRKFPALIKEVSNLKKAYQDRIDVKLGIEANIVGLDGTTDVPGAYAHAFEVVALGYHRTARGTDFKSNAFLHIKLRLRRPRCKEMMTDMLIAAMERNRISFLAHPGQHTGPLDWVRLAKACAKHNVAIELSARAGHLCFTSADVRLMRDYGAVFVVSSDAHKKEEIGVFDSLEGLIEGAQLTYHDIVNAIGYDKKRPFGL